ncbi:MAG: hypothetical protein ACE14Q_00935 [Acidobacteriota bacterium]
MATASSSPIRRPFYLRPPWNILFEISKLEKLTPWNVNIAYLLLKTPFGARITPDGLFLSKIAEPPKSFLTPYLKLVLKTFATGFEEALKGKKR